VCCSLSLSLSFSFCLHAREHIVIKKGKNNQRRKDKSTCINSGAAEAMAALTRGSAAKHGIPEMHEEREREREREREQRRETVKFRQKSKIQ